MCPTAALPLGALGDLPPLSIISGDAVQLDLNVSVTAFPGPKTFDLVSLGKSCERSGYLSKAPLIPAVFRTALKVLMSVVPPCPC